MYRGGRWGLVLLLAGWVTATAQDDVVFRRSVVKVFCTNNGLNLSSPWKRGDGQRVTGSGIWLGDGRVLTNEHLVDYATQISVQPYESAERIPAEVVVASPEMDLVIIELDSPGPLAGLEPPTFAKELPSLQSTVQVFGYPEGGSSLSVTQGIVSRIEYRSYSHGVRGLRVQVDAAINPGNSGGPAYVDDRIVGIAFQKRTRSDNIGYLIPSEEVLRFFHDVEDGSYEGDPELPIVHQRLLNRGLRAHLGLDPDTTGVWVSDLIGNEEDYPVRVGDVVTHIGEHDIDNEGDAKLVQGLRVDFEYFVSRLATGGTVPLRVVRGAEQLSVEAPVRMRRRQLLPPLKGAYPTYFVYGPLVFIAATSNFQIALEALLASSDTRQRISGLGMMTLMSRRRSPLILRRYESPEFDNEQLVMVTNWLPHRIGIGYSSPNTKIVKLVNGVEIRSLEHLVETLRDLEDAFVVFEFADEHVERLVFDREQLMEASEEILVNNGIPRRGSSELMEIWNNKE